MTLVEFAYLCINQNKIIAAYQKKPNIISNTDFFLKYRLRLYFKADFQSAAKIKDFGEISIELCFRRLSPLAALRRL